MTTPADAQAAVNAAIKPGIPGGITAISLAAVLTTIIAVFALYAPLSNPTFSGVVTTPAVIINGNGGGAITSSGPGGAMGTAALTGGY